jgi:cytochrome c biogenesis factor
MATKRRFFMADLPVLNLQRKRNSELPPIKKMGAVCWMAKKWSMLLWISLEVRDCSST